MKCISRIRKVLAVFLACMTLAGCSQDPLVKAYKTRDNGSMWKAQGELGRKSGMAAELCVANEEILPDNAEPLDAAGSAALFDISNRQVLYAHNIHEKHFPASITKIMTALLFFESYQGDYTDMVTVSENVVIKESGAQLCGYKPGDQVSVEQLLNGLLIYSGNDAALVLAEYVAGSEAEFVNKMNNRAVALGATNTHFMNPHGLHDEEHYTTAYDLYLIFQQVMKYDKFRSIINANLYEGEYTLADGTAKKVSWKSTNLFLSGDKEVPQQIVVLGGKTGTTKAAGSCLILLSQNVSGSDFVSVILQDKDKDTLYADMTKLLIQISN